MLRVCVYDRRRHHQRRTVTTKLLLLNLCHAVMGPCTFAWPVVRLPLQEKTVSARTRQHVSIKPTCSAHIVSCARVLANLKLNASAHAHMVGRGIDVHPRGFPRGRARQCPLDRSARPKRTYNHAPVTTHAWRHHFRTKKRHVDKRPVVK